MPYLVHSAGVGEAGYKAVGASKEAAEKIASTDLQEIHHKIMEILETGDYTNDEIAEILYERERDDMADMRTYAQGLYKKFKYIPPRMTHLKQRGLVKIVGRGRSFGGSACDVYGLARPTPRYRYDDDGQGVLLS